MGLIVSKRCLGGIGPYFERKARGKAGEIKEQMQVAIENK